MLMLTQFLKPMFEEFMTEEVMMSEYSDFVQSDLPQNLGIGVKQKGEQLHSIP